MKLKKKVKKFLIITLLLISVFFFFNRVININFYKLTKIGYNINEIVILKEKLNKKELKIILKKNFNSSIPKVVAQKYFIFNNLDRYLDYQSKNSKETMNNVITIVNVNRDRDYYVDIKEMDSKKEHLMLLNKYYFLKKSFIPKDIVNTSSTYSYANNSLNKEAYEAFKKLHQEALKSGYTILINSSYRDYESQEVLWKTRENLYGEKKADEFAARAGHSEHQAGYAIDVADFHNAKKNFEDTKAFNWMKENSYKYGYILRYPKNKENITGYSYESWHYRYVGIEAAKIIYEEDLTFDEYYAYYIENKEKK